MISGPNEPYSIFSCIVSRSLRVGCNAHKGMCKFHMDMPSNLRKCECEFAKLLIAADDVDVDKHRSVAARINVRLRSQPQERIDNGRRIICTMAAGKITCRFRISLE